MENILLQVKNLKTFFYTEEGVIPAVDGLDFSLAQGETLAIVGESGCGKSVTALSILRIVTSPPGKIIDGKILYHGEDLLKKTENEMRKIQGNEISMIFQEPLTSLNPVFTVGSQIMESLMMHQNMNKRQARQKATEMIRKVGIPTPERIMDNYPHQLSGGMRQRIMIAMALACNPKILIADEPTTALDVTIQAQILELLADIKRETNTAIVLITHDLGIVAQIAHNVLVMYAGQAVEYANVREIFKDPRHPYTTGLLNSVPVIGEHQDSLTSIRGSIPGIKDYPVGCRFSPRCDYASGICMNKIPDLYALPGNRLVRCWKYAGKEDT